jgi:hypothetical protein
MPNYTDQQFAAELSLVHGLAASLGDARQRYEATGDPRYLESIRMVFPMFQGHLRRLQEIAADLNGRDVPPQFLVTLDKISDVLLRSGDTVVATIGKVAGESASIVKFAALAVIAGALVWFSYARH